MEWGNQQSAALTAVDDWLKDVNGPQLFRLFGFAGTGKTTLARHIASHVNGVVLFAAFTGKASVVLRKKGCPGATTIHSLIYRPVQDKQTGDVTFVLNPDSPLRTAKLLVVDEISNVNKTLAMDLMSFGCRILVLGDPEQLPPVQGEGYFINAEPDIALTDIHRQAQDNPIIRMSMEVREYKSLQYGRYGDSMVIRRSKLSDQDVLDIIGATDQVLVGYNNTRKTYNSVIRSTKGFDPTKPVVGDRLVCLRNNHEKNLLNGELWDLDTVFVQRPHEVSWKFTLQSADDPARAPITARVLPNFFDGTEGGLDWRQRAKYDEFTYGWALTVHKCVHPDTLIETVRGLIQIKRLQQANASKTGLVATPRGVGVYNEVIRNYQMPAITITCEGGFAITATKYHRVETITFDDVCSLSMRERIMYPIVKTASAVVVGDEMRVRLGMSIDAESMVTFDNYTWIESVTTCTSLVAACLGMMFAVTCNRTVKALYIPHCDRYQTVDVFKLVFGADSIELNEKSEVVFSEKVTSWFTSKISPEGEFPLCILQSPIGVQRRFLHNLLLCLQNNSTHTTVCVTNGHIIQQLLLRLKIVLKAVGTDGEYTTFSKSTIEVILNEYIWEADNLIERVSAIEWFNVKVTNVEPTMCESFCLNVQGEHRFIQNGFPHFNSQGSQWDTVTLVDESSGFKENASKHLYTGITRAAEQVIVIR